MSSFQFVPLGIRSDGDQAGGQLTKRGARSLSALKVTQGPSYILSLVHWPLNPTSRACSSPCRCSPRLSIPRLEELITLTNRVVIEVHSCSFRAVRGYTVVACLADEIAFWTTDEGGANPDHEVLNAVRPAMATVPGSMLLCASSPYARRGALWESYSRNFGKAGGPLVWQASTRQMNPTVNAGLHRRRV